LVSLLFILKSIKTFNATKVPVILVTLLVLRRCKLFLTKEIKNGTYF